MKSSLVGLVRPLFASFFLLLAISPPARAQSGGSLAGMVSNAGTGAFLAGARVDLPALGRQALTDPTGRYEFTGVPAGNYTVKASYLGLDDAQKTVRVGAGGPPATVDFDLGSSTYQLSQMVVVGEREGNAASLVEERLADRIVNVVSVDAYGNVADGNIGNFLQRLPGVAVAKGDGGDVNGVMLRGAPPDMSLVSVDGDRLVSADAGGGRAANIALVPAELIKEVEVNKTLMPDMEIDGIGGSVNLTTKSAFDFRNRYIRYLAAYSLNTYRAGNPWQPYYTLTAMDKFGPGHKLGVAFTGSFNRIVNPLDRAFGQYLFADKRDTIARLLDDTLTREKAGTGLKFEYRFDDTASAWFNVLYTYANQTSVRYNWDVVGGGAGRIADYSRVSRAAIEAGTAARDSLNQTAGVAPGFTDTYTELLSASLINQPALIGPILSRQYMFDTGFKKSWAGFDLQAAATFSPAETKSNSTVVSFTLPAIGVAVDTSAGMPKYTQLYGATTVWAGSDFSKYSPMTYQYQPSEAKEELATAQIDLSRRIPQGESSSLVLKAGLKFRRQHRTFVTDNPRWNYVGADGVAGLNKATGVNDDNQQQFIVGPAYALFNGQYPAVDKPSVPLVQALFASHPEYFKDSNATNDIRNTPFSEITEDVAAGYLMGTEKIGRQLTLVGGLRYERTSDDATGTFASSLAPKNVTTTDRHGDYAKIFPSLHADYEPLPGLKLRAAISTSMARPTIRNIVPTTTVTESTTGGVGTITQNNVDLKPMYSKNYDLMVDYYLRRAGKLSAGVFRKDITDFIATFSSVIPDGANNGFNGAYPGYTLRTSTNLGTARIEGYELNYSQQLTALPKPFDGLGVFGNYTHLKTTGSYDNGATALANFVPETVNAGVSYTLRGVTVQGVYAYKSPYLVSYSPTPISSTYQTVDETFNVHVQYQFRPWLNAYVDVVNLFNRAPSTYSIDQTRIYIWNVWGTQLTVGFSGRF